jgi:hypothetical protein
MKAANLSSEKTEKLLSHPDTPVSSIYTGCVNVNNKFVSFLVSSKTRATLMTFETSSFVIRFFQFLFYVQKWMHQKLNEE